MKIRIHKGTAAGCISVPTSKSMAHRLLICAAMSCGESVIRGISDCEDVQATLDCLRVVGVECRQTGDVVQVRGIDFRKANPMGVLPCRESGSTLRFLIPALLLTGVDATFSGYGRLMERPMQIYEALCKERGLRFFQTKQSITVGGRLPSGVYRLAGNVSSQFISGLLFALPLTDGESDIFLTTAVESRSYLDLTIDAMRSFGVVVEWVDDFHLHIPKGQSYQPCEISVEGDYSNAAFPDALNFFGGKVELLGLRRDSLQGDRCYLEAMQALHAGKATVSLKNCPDLGPVLFAVAAAKHGGYFTDTRRLSIKESDRVLAMQQELAKLGCELIAQENCVEVLPCRLHAPESALMGHNDHRIVMSLSLLLTLVGGEIEGAEAVKKSYPAFFEDLRKLGIIAEEIFS